VVSTAASAERSISEMATRFGRTLADFAHNCVAHPLLFLTGDSWWATWLHDWTASTAYPDDPSG
jgi:hypothetical protein